MHTHTQKSDHRSRAKFRMRVQVCMWESKTDLTPPTAARTACLGFGPYRFYIALDSQFSSTFHPTVCAADLRCAINRFTCRWCSWLQGAQGVATTGGGGARSQPVAERSAGPRWAARERERGGGHGPAAAMDDDCSSEIVTEDVPERRHKVSSGPGGPPRRALPNRSRLPHCFSPPSFGSFWRLRHQNFHGLVNVTID
jgi:hypothetical protein